MTIYKEIDETSRQNFVEKLKTIPVKSLVYVDETGIDRWLYREYARAVRGQKVIAKIGGRKFKRTNIVVGIYQGKWIAPLAYEGMTDNVLFEFWFKNCLLQELEKNSTIVLDNAAFHKKTVLKNLAERYQCHILFLHPYSPDLNPKERKWAWFKRMLCGFLTNFDSLEDAL